MHVTVPFEAGEPPSEADKAEGLLFWSSTETVEWFKHRGYTLYDHVEDGMNIPTLPFKSYDEACYPWPYYDAKDYQETNPTADSLWVFNRPGKIMFAQDACNRHVVIKIVRADTDEYHILRFLSEQSMGTLEENCVIPVLDLLPAEGYWFAIMPRWGTEVVFPVFEYLAEAVDVIHSMLKGLTFLHSNNIAHGDIGLHNVVVNHFCDECNFYESPSRKKLRQEGQLLYALFDFDLSSMLPPNADKRNFRLPYDRSFGTFNLSGDTDAGEFNYDPFAFDVGGMGVRLFRQFNCFIPEFPALAPLFDMMTTWDIPRRLTAPQALEFFESRLAELSEDQLQAFVIQECPLGANPWACLPSDVAEQWKMYKTAPQPWTRRVLCWITEKRWMYHVVPWTRWFFFQVFFAVPRRIFRRDLPWRVFI